MSTTDPRPTDGKPALLEALAPVLEHLAGAGSPRPELAGELNAALPVDGPQLKGILAHLEVGMAEGWLCPRESAGVRFGRVAKASPETHGFSIDAVIMDGPGPGHTHPNGEFDLCFAIGGQPHFDGRAPGWTTYSPSSWHVPTVSGGEMVILYFLPEGAIRFEERPQG